MTGRRGKRRKQLLDDVKESRGGRKSAEMALYCALWRNDFGRGNLPDIRQTTVLIKYFRVVKSRRMSWAGHVERMIETRGVYRVFMGKPEEERPLWSSGIEGRIILRWIFRK